MYFLGNMLRRNPKKICFENAIERIFNGNESEAEHLSSDEDGDDIDYVASDHDSGDDEGNDDNNSNDDNSEENENTTGIMFRTHTMIPQGSCLGPLLLGNENENTTGIMKTPQGSCLGPTP